MNWTTGLIQTAFSVYSKG